MSMDIFQDEISVAVERIVGLADEDFSEAAKDSLTKVFRDAMFYIAGDTLDGMCVDIISRSFPLAAMNKRFCTREQIEEASLVLRQELEKGKTELPATLMEAANERCRLLERSILDMFSALRVHKQDICDALFDGRQYTRFLSIRIGAGDFHNGGKSVTVFETELGRMVFKPRSLMTDVRLRDFAGKYFPGCVYIPRCFTDGKSFGVSEYLEKQVASTREGAEAWYRALGGLAVMIKLLGSTDMHHENIMAVNGLPALIDPETILSPQVKGFNTDNGGFGDFLRSSLYYSAMIPSWIGERDISILADTESEYSSVPVIEGKPVGWDDGKEFFFSGLRKTYRSCLDRKKELMKDIPVFFTDIPVRVMLIKTLYYSELIIRTWKRRNLACKEKRSEIIRELEDVLSENRPEDERGLIIAEKTAILRGDIPCFYTYGESSDLYADGRVVYPDGIIKSGVVHSLENLDGMSEKELAFEEDILRAGFILRILKEDTGKPESPERGEKALPPELALKEAEELFTKLYDLRLTAPDGSLNWLSLSNDGITISLLEDGLGTCIAGIGLFAAALMSVSTDPLILEQARKCTDSVHRELTAKLYELKQKSHNEIGGILSLNLGEDFGFGGTLRALVLLERYRGDGVFAPLVSEALELLSGELDLTRVSMSDRLGGIAGLLAALCDCSELSDDLLARDIIAAGAGRLMELKTFKADDHTLWETISKRHLISGAGHGMMGIAYALNAAGKLLDNSQWLAAAKEAVDFELEAYSDKYRTWPDRRTWPPEGIMHGYCSGAPGLGILSKGMDIEGTDTIAEYAADAVDSKPLLFRDHLCCGNSAIAEYYMTMGKKDEAGKVLAGMQNRKEKAGSYRLLSPGCKDIPLPTLLSGLSGIGYEFLRYAFTDRIYPVWG